MFSLQISHKVTNTIRNETEIENEKKKNNYEKGMQGKGEKKWR